MKIIVADWGYIWNETRPILEEYKESVLFINYYNRIPSEKYKCFMLPKPIGIDGDSSIDGPLCTMLKNKEEELCSFFEPGEDIIILSDNTPESLFPFHVLKNKISQYNIHLLTLSPWRFMPPGKKKMHNDILRDLEGIKSFIYVDGQRILEDMDREATLPDLIEYTYRELAKILPEIVDKTIKRQ